MKFAYPYIKFIAKKVKETLLQKEIAPVPMVG